MLQMRGQSGLLSLASACGAVASHVRPSSGRVPALPATPHSYGHLCSLRSLEPLAIRPCLTMNERAIAWSLLAASCRCRRSCLLRFARVVLLTDAARPHSDSLESWWRV